MREAQGTDALSMYDQYTWMITNGFLLFQKLAPCQFDLILNSITYSGRCTRRYTQVLSNDYKHQTGRQPLRPLT